MDICQNLNSILKERKITQKELCQQISIAESKLSYWLTKSKVIPSEYIIPICNYLNISPSFLLTGQESDSKNHITLSKEEIEFIKEYRYLSDKSKSEIRNTLNHLYDIEKRMETAKKFTTPTIPVKHSIFKVSAGMGEWLADEEWDKITILDTPQARKATFALTIEGDSMMPDFEDGDIVLVKQQDAVDIGQICIYTVDGKGYIKKFGGDRLISLNDDYDDIIFKDYQNIHCQGLVIGKV